MILSPKIMEREFPIIGITPDLLKWIKALKENYQTHYDTISRSICEELNEELSEEMSEKMSEESDKDKEKNEKNDLNMNDPFI